MEFKIKDDNDELKNVIGEYVLKESNDKSGFNLCLDIKNHKDENQNRRHYILRILKSGELLLFGDNNGIGLKVDGDGKINIKENA